MPTLNATQLLDLGRSILKGAGVPTEDASVVAAELADANLVGHDSHGVMRLMQYVQFVEEGFVQVGTAAEVVHDTPAVVVVDGHFNFGQVTMATALKIGIERAKLHGSANVFVRNCNHIGRLGAYTERAANEGLAATMAVNAPGPGGVAPFGGMERRLGTNPISMAAPGTEAPVVLDMTTSATAEGKLRVSHQKGESIPEGLIIDGHGRPSSNPGDYYNKPFGSILPLGMPMMGHKGFGLSVMIDLFCGILSGSGVCRDDLPRGANGVWMSLIDIEPLMPQEDYQRWMATYSSHIKDCPRLPGVEEILLPGEIERRRRLEREATGVPIPDETWRQLTELATRLKVTLPI